jgi:cytochrome c oxidase cbb3-type subunit 1
MFFCSACWLVLASAFALISSIKFHSPSFLADSACLTYGRVHTAYLNCLLYGFCLQAGLGVALWLLARLGQTPLAQPWLVIVGTLLWNAGIKLGVLGILRGDGTGFEYLDIPGYAAWITILGYLLIGLSGVLTFHQRCELRLFVSQWFIFTALFWFPWIYATAELLLVKFPVRGAAQVAVWAYYNTNLSTVWLPLVGLAAIFYFIPKLTQRDLHSGYLALFAFWMLILFGGWTGITHGAPLPAWMPAISTVATMLLAVPLLAVALNVHLTLYGKSWHRSADIPVRGAAVTEPADRNVRAPMPPPDELRPSLRANAPLQFITVGAVALVLAWLMKMICAGVDVAYPLNLTWLTPAREQLNSYGFFSLVMFGAIYAILPRLTQTEFPSPRLVRAHFWLALLGVLLTVVPLAGAGIVEALRMHDPDVPFVAIVKSTLPFLRASTTGDLFLAFGHVIFLINVAGLAVRFYRPRVAGAYADATADLSLSEAQP